MTIYRIDTDRMRTRREAMGLKQSDVAERCGMPQQHYQRIESGARKTPTAATLALIADALNLGVGKLLLRVEKK